MSPQRKDLCIFTSHSLYSLGSSKAGCLALSEEERCKPLHSGGAVMFYVIVTINALSLSPQGQLGRIPFHSLWRKWLAFQAPRDGPSLVCAFGAEAEMIWIPRVLGTPALQQDADINQNQMERIGELYVICMNHTQLLSPRRHDWVLIANPSWWCC